MAGATTEFDLIARIRARAGTRDDVSEGIGDDAAILRLAVGQDLVVSTDTLNSGVHFPHDTKPSDIGWKALAVNLSDLAAMGAKPVWCTLNLTIPSADGDWLDEFLNGFLVLAAQRDVALVGGDTTRGPLSVTVTALGYVPRDAAMRRSGAQVGDDVWVSGTLGDAAAALRQWRDGSVADAILRGRMDRPTPRTGLGMLLRGIANACVDISDGLLADIDHILDASHVGAEIDVASLPTSPELENAIDAATRIQLQLGGGDDYELCFTAPPMLAHNVLRAARQSRVAVTRIGRIDRTPGLRLRDASGIVSEAPRSGYRHFDESSERTDYA